jgi:hypothetical protein
MAATIQDVHGVERVVFSMTGVFGVRLAGDSYNLIGRAVDDHRHNRLLPHVTDVDGPIPHSMIAEALIPLLSTGQSIFDTVPWKTYMVECTKFIVADSDSTDGSRKIREAQISHELMSLSRTAVEADVADVLTGLESVEPIVRLHRLILLRTAPLRMDENSSTWSSSPDPSFE